MDAEQEVWRSSTGYSGIMKEAVKAIVLLKSLFAQVTVASVIPISLLVFSLFHISEILLKKMYDNGKASPGLIIAILCMNLAYYVLLCIFSLLSAAMVIYTMACLYSSKEMSFRMILSAVPEICRRIMVNGVWKMLAYQFFYMFLSVIYPLGYWTAVPVAPFLQVITAIAIGSLRVFSFLWHFSCVVSLTEAKNCTEAMDKVLTLTHGNNQVVLAVILLNPLAVGLIGLAYYQLIVHETSWGLVSKVIIGVLCFVSHTIVVLFDLVVQTLLYFSCKSHHHERIDKSFLRSHLDVYLKRISPTNGV